MALRIAYVTSGMGLTGTAIIQLTKQIEAATGVNILSRLQQTPPPAAPVGRVLNSPARPAARA